MVSGYKERFRSDVIKSAVECYNKQCSRADAGIVQLHRPCEFDEKNRRKKKLMSKTSWYRPADTVLFIPSTPDSELANRVRSVVCEEGERLGRNIRVVDTGGTNIKDIQVTPDLMGCIWPHCVICEEGEAGAAHTHSGAVCQATSTLCEESQML